MHRLLLTFEQAQPLFCLWLFTLAMQTLKRILKRKEFQEIVKDKFTVFDSFYYEGDITYFEGTKAHEIETEWKE